MQNLNPMTQPQWIDDAVIEVGKSLMNELFTSSMTAPLTFDEFLLQAKGIFEITKKRLDVFHRLN